MKNIAAASRVKVSADGHGVVSHAGMAMLRELADRTGLSAQVTALADTYRGPWAYSPGEVFADLAAAVADGADCIDGVGQLCGDREHAFGAKASTTTMWRLVDERIDTAHLPAVQAARATARAAAWAAGAAPAPGGWLHIDIDATLVIDHSDNKHGATSTWKKSFGHHPLLAFLDRPEIAGGEALAGLLRSGNAGSNTASDHIIVLQQALAALPAAWRPDPSRGDDPDRPQVLVRCDTAGATHRFADACREQGVGFSFGYPVDARVQDAVDTLNLAEGWYPAIDTDGGLRDGAWVAEATTLVNLNSWPPSTRLILRKEPPSRRPVAVHRHRRDAGHRVHHRHTHRCRGRSGRRPGVAAPLARPRRGPHPRTEGHRPAQPAVSVLLGQRRLAGDRAGRRRPGHLVPPARIPKRSRPGPRRDHHVPLPRAARRRPHHPRCAPAAAAHRCHLALGRPDRDRLADHPHRLRITEDLPDRPITKDPLALGKPAPPGDTGPPRTPGDHRTQLATHSAADSNRHHLRRKIEAIVLSH
ncbi:hypothetical protein MycrhDRAFT_6506 [Mycolicibacterium rhodesiae JS60]|nr:hypothetical protein MycrhDRAFT_6506 [Mycolicibacterium rhodesiae JS60]